MESSFVDPVFVWSCQRASPGRAVGAQADGSLTPMIGVTSVETEAIMLTTAIVSAREAAVAAGLALTQGLAPGPGPGPVDAVITLVLAAGATAGAAAGLHPIPDAGAGLALQPVPSPSPSPGLRRGVAPGLGPVLRQGDALSPDPAHEPRPPTTRGTVVPVQEVQTEALHQQMTE